MHVLLSEFEIPKGVIAKDQKFQSSVLKVTVIFFFLTSFRNDFYQGHSTKKMDLLRVLSSLLQGP